MRRVGIDVGGTNTDAVLIEEGKVIRAVKAPTSEDVTGGILEALTKLGQTGLVQSCDRVIGIIAEELKCLVGGKRAAPREKTRKRIVGRGRSRHDELSLRPIQHLTQRRLENRQIAGFPALQDVSRNHRKGCDLDPLQTHARSTRLCKQAGPARAVSQWLLAQS